MATSMKGSRYHGISFEPWPGGPSTTITWNLPRKCLSLCPPGHGTSTATASAGGGGVAIAAPALELLAASTGGPEANDTPAAATEEDSDGLEDSAEEDDDDDMEEDEEEGGEDSEEDEGKDEEDEDEEEDEEDEGEQNGEVGGEGEGEKESDNENQGGGGAGDGGQKTGQLAEKEQAAGSGRAVLSPPPESVLVYPTGTVVVVKSVQRKPGRTLKFARGETYEATFEELLGREVGWSETRVHAWCFFFVLV